MPKKGIIDSMIELLTNKPGFCNKLRIPLTVPKGVTLLLLINLLIINNVFKVGMIPTVSKDVLVTWYNVVNIVIVRVGKDKCDTNCVSIILAILCIGLENRDKYINRI